MGSFAGNGSGDMFVAFSTANADALKGAPLSQSTSIGNDHIDPLFAATVQATEEAIVNALLAAETMTGANGVRVHALPADRVVAAMLKHGRLP